MTLTNISDFGNSLKLVYAANPIYLNIIVDSPYQPKLVASINYRILPSDSFQIETIAVIELINYKKVGTSYYFTADISNIVNTLFTELDDHTVSEDTFEELQDMVYDIYIDVTASNGVDSDVTDQYQFTAYNGSAQFGENLIIASNRSTVARDTTDEIVYAGNSNVVYLYVITAENDQPTLYPLAENVLIDSNSDASILTDSDDQILTE